MRGRAYMVHSSGPSTGTITARSQYARVKRRSSDSYDEATSAAATSEPATTSPSTHPSI